MKYELEKLKGEVKLSFSLDAASWDKEIENAYNKTKHKYNLQGFRKGKAPRKVIEKYYGEGVFFDDAFQAAASKAYTTALTENSDIQPVDEPKVDITQFGEGGKALEFTMTVTVRPEVTLGEYKGIKVPKVEYKTTAEDIDNDIKAAREKASRLIKVTDRPVKDGDSINLDYSGSVNGVKFDGGTAEKQTLVIGSNSFIPGFEAQMLGMKIGETKDINVKFPDEYHSEELKGKDAVFTVTVNEISYKELPEADDNFAKDTSKFENFADYKADVEKRLTEQNNNRTDNENKNKMIEIISGNATIDIPACMIDDETEYMLEDFAQRLRYMYGGMNIDDYFKYTNTTRDAFKAERREEAEKAVKTRLVLQEIIKKENIEVTDADLDAFIEKIAVNAGKSAAEYKKTLNAQQTAHIKNDVLITKLLDFLTAANEFVLGAEEKPKKETVKKEPAAKKETTKKATVKDETAQKE